MNRYIAVVIGAGGSIGGLKSDKLDNLDTFNVLTHCHALSSRSPKVSLVAVSDINKDKLNSVCKKWCTKGYLDYKEMLDKEKPNIVVVATPTETHYEVLIDIANSVNKPKAVIAEKPFCNDMKQAKSIVELYQNLNLPIAVDYIRRYDTTVQNVKKDIENGILGKIQNCRILYTRGLIRDASHAIDICRFLFGEYKCGRIDRDTFINDYSDNDLTYKADLEFELCNNVNLTPIDGRCFDLFEIDIIGTKGRIKFVEHGLEVQYFDVIKEKVYGNYNTINHIPKYAKTTLNTALLNLVNNVIDHLENGKELICSGWDGLETQKILNNLLSSY